MIYSFDVAISTHDLLKAGVTEARLWGSPQYHHRVVVDAPTRDEAALTAAQMVSCFGICTGLYDRIRHERRAVVASG